MNKKILEEPLDWQYCYNPIHALVQGIRQRIMLEKVISNDCLWICESHIFELQIKTWIWKRSLQLGTLLKQAALLNCEDRFHIHVFICSSNIWLSYLHSCLFTTSQVYLEPTQWSAPSWLVSSVGRALHQYCRGHGFKSHTGLNFFQAFFSLLLK